MKFDMSNNECKFYMITINPFYHRNILFFIFPSMLA